MNRRPTTFIAFAAASLLALAGCNKSGTDDNLAALDKQLTGNDVDPALTSALADQIAIDPSLASASNKNAARPAETPVQSQYPAPAPGAPQTADAAPPTGGCSLAVKFDYNLGWAKRLPAAFPIYPGARLGEAAGNDTGACRMRVVSFTTGDDWQHVLDWYNTRAVRSGYSVDHQLRGQDHVLAGDRGSLAYYLIATPIAAGTDVSLIVNAGT